MKKSKKRGRKASEITKKKQTKSTMSEVLGVPVESQKVAENSILKQNLLNLNTRTHKRDKKVMFDISAIEHVPENISVLGVEASPLNQDNDTVVTDLPASSDKKESSNKSIGRRRDQPKRLKTHNLGSSKNNITQNQSKEDFISQLSSIYLPLADKKNVPDLGVKTSKSEIKTTTNPKCDQDMRSKKQKIYTDEISKDNKLVDAALDGCNEVTVKKTQLSEKVQGIKASMKAMEPVDEQLYEIGVDIHGIKDGPRLGRLRVLNKQPKLFNGFKFYFAGDFVTSYKGYLHDLITAAGGTVLQRKPIPSGHESLSTFIIYSRELPDKCDPSKRNLIFNTRQSDAKALASSTGATVASNSWVLNSIAACKLQNLAE
ncbi:hypothetical protein HYC85_030195 [Camellia sinensis]|uniref:BRCT domain-containing protein n=1 Tax=Camellia sinensis TaxID=4442 RepID=A0A7J7G3V8_CAMSI|nr:hypothetical protein HYC85_030195 [Camellia sinensis]